VTLSEIEALNRETSGLRRKEGKRKGRRIESEMLNCFGCSFPWKK
jgi:hypothetical protein